MSRHEVGRLWQSREITFLVHVRQRFRVSRIGGPMSSLALPDEAPFVFGAYASHLNEVVPAALVIEAETVEPPLRPHGEPDVPVQPLAGGRPASR